MKRAGGGGGGWQTSPPQVPTGRSLHNKMEKKNRQATDGQLVNSMLLKPIEMGNAVALSRHRALQTRRSLIDEMMGEIEIVRMNLGSFCYNVFHCFFTIQ